MWTLGLNGEIHDSAACIVDSDGRIVVFAEEERFTRVRHALGRGPVQATAFCLQHAGLAPEDIDVVAIGWDMPRLRARAGRRWTQDSSRELLHRLIGWEISGRRRPDIVYIPHHIAHASCTFHASGFERAAVLVVDGNGEDEAISIFAAERGRPLLRRRLWPVSQSLGYLYDAPSCWVGFGVYGGGKTMGLAAYGSAAGITPWPLVTLTGDDFRPAFGWTKSEDYDELIEMWRRIFSEYAGVDGPRQDIHCLDRDPGATAVAWSAQAAVEEVVPWLAREARKEVGAQPLCLAGGVALNCAANGLLDEPVFVPPVPNDAGVALGAAWQISPPRDPLGPINPYLGLAVEAPAERDIPAALQVARREVTADEIAQRLIDHQFGAVVEGRAEVGPRALCHRSIIALPHPAEVHRRLNAVKGREPWRPFGPVTLPSCAGRFWTDQPYLSRYMVGAAQVTPEGCATAPAAVHVDGSTRPQTILGDQPSIVGDVLCSLERAGVPPVLIDTSFNRRGEPIVNDAHDALDAFSAMNLDFLVLGDVLVTKNGR